MKLSLVHILKENVGGNSFKKKLKAYFHYLTLLGDEPKELLDYIENSGWNSLNQSDFKSSYDKLISGLKLVGLDPGYVGYANRLKEMKKLYSLLITYEHNGGKNTDFKRIGEIELIPAKVWNVELDYSEPVIEYGTFTGEIFNRSKEKAEQLMLNYPYDFMSDRETYDQDYPEGETFAKELTDISSEDIILEPSLFT